MGILTLPPGRLCFQTHEETVPTESFSAGYPEQILGYIRTKYQSAIIIAKCGNIDVHAQLQFQLKQGALRIDEPLVN